MGVSRVVGAIIEHLPIWVIRLLVPWANWKRRRQRGGATFPSLEDFDAMGPEQTAQWMRETGIEARVIAAIDEWADDPDWFAATTPGPASDDVYVDGERMSND